jgi:hypothetical protein
VVAAEDEAAAVAAVADTRKPDFHFQAGVSPSLPGRLVDAVRQSDAAVGQVRRSINAVYEF